MSKEKKAKIYQIINWLENGLISEKECVKMIMKVRYYA